MLEETPTTAIGKLSNVVVNDGPSNTSEIAKAALWYASKGLKIFPCGPEKRPLVRWKDEMSSDPAQIRKWWDVCPEAMIGLPCGTVNGMAVLDIDVRSTVDGFESLKSKSYEIPQGTFAVSTPSGGKHYYFKLRDGELIRNSAGKIGRGIDVRGEGGYVIAPPSFNAAGIYAVSDCSNWKQFEELVQ